MNKLPENYEYPSENPDDYRKSIFNAASKMAAAELEGFDRATKILQDRIE